MTNLDKYSRTLNEQPGRGLNPVVAAGIAMGGVLPMIGWLVVGFGMIFVWVFGSQSEAFVSFRGIVRPADGRVLAVTQTSVSEGGTKTSPGTPVYRVEFEYDLSTGMTRRDECFTLGSQFTPGQAVRVEFVEGPPPRARIQGTRLAPFESWVLFVFVFPLIGLLLVVVSYVLGFRTLAIIRRGKLATGRLVDKQATNTKINNQTVYKLTFEFIDDRGDSQRATTKTHRTSLVEDQAEERLFYDPRNPSNARLVDLLPRGLRVGDDGTIHAGSSAFLVISTVVVPALVIGVHGFVGWMMFA